MTMEMRHSKRTIPGRAKLPLSREPACRPTARREPRPTLRTRWLLNGLLLVCSLPVAAHHILGVPHYAYDEDYPQAPVLTYKVQAGPNEVEMTTYPGRPAPGERCSLHVYILPTDKERIFDAPVTLTVFRDRMIGADPVVYGPMEAQREEALYKFYPQFPLESDYVVRIDFMESDESWTIDLPIVVGEPGSPWVLLGGIAFGVIAFLVVIRALRIKMQRRTAAAPQDVPA
jgi:hypothetical protein